MLDGVVRAGVPLGFTIKRRQFEYYLTIDQVSGIPVEQKVKMAAPKGASDLLLFSPRDDIIREDAGYTGTLSLGTAGAQQAAGGGTDLPLEFHWWFKRRAESTAAP